MHFQHVKSFNSSLSVILCSDRDTKLKHPTGANHHQDLITCTEVVCLFVKITQHCGVRDNHGNANRLTGLVLPNIKSQWGAFYFLMCQRLFQRVTEP